jgi:hypothetical protein
MEDPAFLRDIDPLLREDQPWNVHEASSVLLDEIVALLPGEAWAGGRFCIVPSRVPKPTRRQHCSIWNLPTNPPPKSRKVVADTEGASIHYHSTPTPVVGSPFTRPGWCVDGGVFASPVPMLPKVVGSPGSEGGRTAPPDIGSMLIGGGGFVPVVGSPVTRDARGGRAMLIGRPPGGVVVFVPLVGGSVSFLFAFDSSSLFGDLPTGSSPFPHH